MMEMLALSWVCMGKSQGWVVLSAITDIVGGIHE